VEKRREPVRRLAGAVGSALAALAAASATACELPPGVRVETERIAISYSTIPAKILVGQPFVLDLAACPKQLDGEIRPVSDRVRMDAHMPEHRHGMNYRAKVESLGSGRYHSEGWLFHMPGRWEFVFDVGAERLTHSVRVE
jgi:hypothetical protein